MTYNQTITDFQRLRARVELWSGAFQWMTRAEYDHWYAEHKWIAKRRHESNLKLLDALDAKLNRESDNG